MISPLLTKNDQREHFSLTYLKAIATSAGFSMDIPSVDRDSIDAQVRARGSIRPMLDFQLKATSSPDIKPDGLHFSLPRKNYDDLREKRLVPALLAVYEMPTAEADWFHCGSKDSTLKSRMWWMSLKDAPAITRASKTVVLPHGQFLTPASLTTLLTSVSMGRRP